MVKTGPQSPTYHAPAALHYASLNYHFMNRPIAIKCLIVDKICTSNSVIANINLEFSALLPPQVAHV